MLILMFEVNNFMNNIWYKVIVVGLLLYISSQIVGIKHLLDEMENDIECAVIDLSERIEEKLDSLNVEILDIGILVREEMLDLEIKIDDIRNRFNIY